MGGRFPAGWPPACRSALCDSKYVGFGRRRAAGKSPAAVTAAPAAAAAAAAAVVRRRSGGGEGDRNETRSPKKLGFLSWL